jgi:hypothetical protein
VLTVIDLAKGRPVRRLKKYQFRSALALRITISRLKQTDSYLVSPRRIACSAREFRFDVSTTKRVTSNVELPLRQHDRFARRRRAFLRTAMTISARITSLTIVLLAASPPVDAAPPDQAASQRRSTRWREACRRVVSRSPLATLHCRVTSPPTPYLGARSRQTGAQYCAHGRRGLNRPENLG